MSSPSLKFKHDVGVDHVWHVAGHLAGGVAERLVVQRVHMAQRVPERVQQQPTTHSRGLICLLVLLSLQVIGCNC